MRSETDPRSKPSAMPSQPSRRDRPRRLPPRRPPPREAKAKPKITFKDHVAADLPEPLQRAATTPTSRRGASTSRPTAAPCRGAARARSSSRATRTPARFSASSQHDRRAEDAAELAEDPRRRDRHRSAQWIEAGRSETVGQRGGGQGEAEVRVQARPLRDRQAGRRARDARGPAHRAVRRQRPGQRRRRRWPRAPGPRSWPSAGTSRSCSTARPDHHLVGVLPFPEGTIHVLQVQPQRRPRCWPAAGAAASRAWRWSSTSRPASGSSRSARSTTPSSPPTSAPTTAWSPSAGRARSSGSTTRPTAARLEMKKHTEWVTAVEFSPDGVLLATGDRNNGLIVWEAQTGREFHDLRGHTARRSPTSPGGSTPTSSPRRARTARSGSGRWRTARRSRPGAPTAAAPPRSGSPRTAGSSPPAATGSSGSGTRTAPSSASSRPFGDLALARRLHPRRRPRRRRRLVGRGPRLGRARTASGSRTSPPTPPRSPPASNKPAGRRPAAQAEADAASKELPPLQAALDEKSGLTTKAQQALADAQEDARRKAELVAATEKLDQERASILAASEEKLKAARLAFETAQAEKSAAEKAIGDTLAAEKASIEALAGSKAAVEKALQDKVAPGPGARLGRRGVEVGHHAGRPPIRPLPRSARSSPGRPT